MSIEQQFNQSSEEKPEELSPEGLLGLENTSEKTLEQKYREEILPLIEILKPEGVPLEEYKDQVTGELFDSAKKIELAQGISLQSPEKNFEQIKSLLVSRIKEIVADGSDWDKIKKMDQELVRHARIAMLFQKDFSDFEERFGHKVFEKEIYGKYNIDFGELRDYVVRGTVNDVKLTEDEVDSLVKADFGENIINSASYDFSNRILGVPESLLVLLAKSNTRELDSQIKFALKDRLIEKSYTENTAKTLMENGYGRWVFENFTKFKNVDFTDAVISRSPRYPYHAIDMSDSLVEQISIFNDNSSEEFNEKLDIVVKHNHITSGDLRNRIQENYKKVIDDAKEFGSQHMERKQAFLDEVTKNNIENGYIGFYSDDMWFMKYLAENHYDWLVESAKKNDQEHLLMKIPSGVGNILKPEDQLKYAKKLIADKKEHLLKLFAEGSECLFDEESLDQEVFDVMSVYGAEINPIIFKRLNEDSFDKLLANNDKTKYFFSNDGQLTKNIKVFDFKENSKFENYKKYQKVVEAVALYFTPNKPEDVFVKLDLDSKIISETPYEEMDNILKQKSVLFEKMKKVCLEMNPTLKDKSFFDKYSFLLEEKVGSLEKKIEQIPFMPTSLVNKASSFSFGLQVFSELDEENKKELKNNLDILYKNKDIFAHGESDLIRRYFNMAIGRDEDVNLFSLKEDILDFVPVYREMDEKEKKLWNVVFPWGPSLEKIDGIQKPSKRTEYDPWRTQFLPFLNNYAHNDISLTNPKDGEMVFDYIDRFGMKNTNFIFPLFLQIYRSKDIDSIPPLMQRELLQTWNIDTHELSKKDNKNVKLVLSELEKVLPKMIADFRTENASAISSVAKSAYAMEFFTTIVGDSGHSHDATTQEAMETYFEALEKSPEKFELPEGYQEVQISVPEVVMQDDEKDIEVRKEKFKIWNNIEINKFINETTENILESKNRNTIDLFQEGINKINSFFYTTERDLKNVLKEEQNKANPNEKAIFGLEHRITDCINKQRIFEKKIESFNWKNYTMVSFMEIVHNTVPDEYPKKKDLLMKVSAQDMSEKIKEGYDSILVGINDPDFYSKISHYNEFIKNHVKEHYLDKKHGLESAIETNDKGLVKALKKYWGTADFDKSILAVSFEKLKMLEKGELSDKTKEISLVPSKGMQRIFSGDLGKACTSRQNGRLARGDFPEIVSYSIVLDKNTKNERFVGSFLIIETENDSGEKTMVLRANNPQQNLFNMVDGDSLIKNIIDEVKELAKRRGIEHVDVPLSGGSTSNRPEVSKYYQKLYGNNKKIQLRNSEETNFNGYDIWNKESGNAVVEI